MEKLKSPTVAALMAALSLAANICMIGGVLWKGGGLARQIEVNSGRLDRLELSGSTTLRAHIDAQMKETESMKDRLARVERAIEVVPDIREELARINTKLDILLPKGTRP